ncbi:septal ring lytic transglycosylase RlpA family protein [Marinobacter fonticola]|uniref:septal ring lytic transglycosylase RlpA family protein n=1 Tax=Marinobacter fonticola TaxID=2603215 RepID=UPI0011E6869D|nr:septal ring lytic transglycosylase RlpA family protein [Marinobacter fonticola]
MVITLRNILITAFLSLTAGFSAAQTGAGEDWVGFTETGKASYYADVLENRKTASGEMFKQELRTAAHKKIPLGSIVKVTNVKNGKSVVVRINDRGPFAKGRIIDLSKSAFSRIGRPSLGLIAVKIEVLKSQ